MWSALRDIAGIVTPNAEPAIFTATLMAFGERAQPHVTVFHDATGPRAVIAGRRSIRRLPCRIGYLTIQSPPLRCLDIVY